MDPDAALDELLHLADHITHADAQPTHVSRIVELIEALDGWLTIGGFLPARWTPGRRPR